MKRSESTEMDRLLRRYSRLKGETLRGASDEATTEAASVAHLDADEMNAYAEGALPEAARSRYFAHLADCDSCRKIVTDLTLAASRADEGKARVASLETTSQKSWREWLAAIFSPPVLRYGVPALVLFAVIIVAFVATRTQREESSIAQNKDESGYSARAIPSDSNSATGNTTAAGTAGSHSNSNLAPLTDQQSQTQPVPAATPPPANTEPLKDKDVAPVASQESVAKSTTAPAGDTKDSSGELEAAGKREQRELAEAPPPPAPQPTVLSAPATTEADKPDERKKAKDAGRDDRDEITASDRSTGRVVAGQAKTAEARPNFGGAAPTASRAARNEQRRASSPAAKSGPPSDNRVTEEEREDRSVETTSVGGRRFRKQGGAWIDTDYKSTQLTNVARGSQQYRALVADEPALRKIAEHFSGEVIVVWKRRAYRFY